MSSAALRSETIAVLDLAREIAEERFGAEAVREIPRLVTDVALLIAQLAQSHAIPLPVPPET